MAKEKQPVMKKEMNHKMNLSKLIIKLLPNDARRRIGNRELTVEPMEDTQGNLTFIGGEFMSKFEYTPHFDIYLAKSKIGEANFKFVNDKSACLEYDLTIGNKRYRS